MPGTHDGLCKRLARVRLRARAVFGGAKMVLDKGTHPGALKDAVTSPGGTTIAGVASLERSGLRSAMIEAVMAAANRADELSKL
jgi:pyrroline-5-carboxylate reductase